MKIFLFNPAWLKKVVAAFLALIVAAAVWLPCLHLFFRKPLSDFYQINGLSPKAKELAARHLQLWTEPALRAVELKKMRASNAEWDFMGRTFLVWSLANIGLRNPQLKSQYLPVMDEIIQETIQIEKELGMYVFLMPYAKERPFRVKPERSCFLDGEIALMMGARRLLEEKPEYKQPMTERLNLIEQRMRSNPLMAMESYPNECWTYDHTVSLVAFKLADRLDGTDHSALCKDWIVMAKQNLVDKKTGLLWSAYTVDGAALYGPEGSSIWMVAHCLQAVDPAFARDQYECARKELGRITLGFGYGLEWPANWQGPVDVDSGMVVPGLGVSAGSSGMAFVAAASFQDWDFLRALSATLDMAAFPSRESGRLKYCASNQVGDAAILYASVLGPLWERICKL
ncbi:MAG TPA: hypothetical protein VGN61_08350 [Verrucomicrobiae bacterium]